MKHYKEQQQHSEANTICEEKAAQINQNNQKSK